MWNKVKKVEFLNKLIQENGSVLSKQLIKKLATEFVQMFQN